MSYDDHYEDAPPRRQTTTGTATSRLNQGRPAIRKQTKARLAISGASGAGKTWTSLSVAEVIAPGQPVMVIDTEPSDEVTGAAELYADRFRFDTIRWEPPYDPRDLALTVAELGHHRVPGSLWPGEGGYAVIIVDSASHFWRGQGGTLDIAGGKYTGWKEATPVQDKLVETILRSPAHVIVCTRARQDYAQEQGPDGKQKVTKLGMAPVQRDDLEYEFQVVVQMDQQHTMEIGKTRCAALAGMQFRQNEQGRFAAILAEWLAGGVELAGQATVDALVEMFDAIDDPEVRKVAKLGFVQTFGRPDQLPADRVDAAEVWITERVTLALAAGGDAPGSPPVRPDHDPTKAPPDSPPMQSPEKAPPAPAEPTKNDPAPDGHETASERTEGEMADMQARVDELAETAKARARARAKAS